MPKKKEGIHKVPRKQSGCVREPKQGPNRRAKNPQRTILPAEN